MFAVRGLPNGLLGESYVIVSAWQESNALWEAEFHVLTSRPSYARTSGLVEFPLAGYPSELPAIDEVYMEGEARQQAEIALIELVDKRAAQENRPDVLSHPFRLEASNISAVSLWTRGIHLDALKSIAVQTRSPKLKVHLRLVMSIHRLERA